MKEKALKIIAKQIKDLDDNAELFKDVKISFATQKIRLELWDILTINGYELEYGTYKLVKKQINP
jgi:hypothetical protein